MCHVDVHTSEFTWENDVWGVGKVFQVDMVRHVAPHVPYYVRSSQTPFAPVAYMYFFFVAIAYDLFLNSRVCVAT